MTNRLARLLVLTAAPIVVSGFAIMPESAARQDGALRGAILSPSRLVSNDELSQMRGGFFTAAGAQFDFGASVQTMVDGKLALLTNVQWTPAGAVTQQLQGLGSAVQAQVANNVATGLANAGIATPGSSVQSNTTSNSTPVTPMPATATSAPNASAPAASLPTLASTLAPSASAAAAPATSLATTSPATSTPASVSAPAASVPAANVPAASVPAASAPAAAAPLASLAANAPAAIAPATGTQAATAAPVTAATAAPTVTSAAPLVLTGVQIPDATGGLTQIFSNIAGGQIQNVILNSASGRDITQNTNITMTIYNFAAWQQQVAQNMLSGRLASDMLASSGIGAGH